MATHAAPGAGSAPERRPAPESAKPVGAGAEQRMPPPPRWVAPALARWLSRARAPLHVRVAEDELYVRCIGDCGAWRPMMELMRGQHAAGARRLGYLHGIAEGLVPWSMAAPLPLRAVMCRPCGVQHGLLRFADCVRPDCTALTPLELWPDEAPRDTHVWDCGAGDAVIDAAAGAAQLDAAAAAECVARRWCTLCDAGGVRDDCSAGCSEECSEESAEDPDEDSDVAGGVRVKENAAQNARGTAPRDVSCNMSWGASVRPARPRKYTI